jgi:hypothetical protein
VIYPIQKLTKMKTKFILLALVSLLVAQVQAQHPSRSHGNNQHAGYYHAKPMHPADFEILYDAVARQGSDNRKMLTILPALENNALTSDQVSMLVSLLSFESNKIDLAKTAWLYVYDPGNYFKAFKVLTFKASIQELGEFMSVNPRIATNPYHPNRHNAYITSMHQPVFLDASQAVKAQPFEDSRLQVAKQIAMSNNLTSQQVYELMELFSFEATRIEFAVFAYRYVLDPGNYFLTHDAFRFRSSIGELNRAIGFRSF